MIRERQENEARQRRGEELFGAYFRAFFVLGRSLRCGLDISQMSIGLEEYRIVRIVRSIGIIGIVLCYLSTLDYVHLKKKKNHEP